MVKILIVLTFLSGCYVTEIKSKSCTNSPYNIIPYCEKLTESMEGYECDDDKCIKRVLFSCKERKVCLTSLHVCKLTCGETPIWPLPSGNTSISKILVAFRPSIQKINVTTSGPQGSEHCKKLHDLIKGLGDKIKEHVLSFRLPTSTNTKMYIKIEVQDDTSIQFTDRTVENYTLYVSGHTEMIDVRIVGKTYFGVRHAVETLQQLIVYDEKSESLVIPSEATIVDYPAYSYRGLMLDTARNYIPVKDINRTLDAMAMNKMNTLHWHMTDSNSFPYVSKKYPKMSVIGAYTNKEVYTWYDIKQVVEHARSCGIRVIPELAAPANVGEGWNMFVDLRTKHKYVACFNDKPWVCRSPPCAQLDVSVPGVYDILGDLYEEFAKLFDADLFHMGADQISPKCWDLAHITKWKTTKNVGDLWEYFQNKSLERLQEANSKIRQVIVWSSKDLVSSEKLIKFRPNSTYIVQVQYVNKDMLLTLINASYSLIVSTMDPHVLDCGFGSWTSDGAGRCDPYSSWYKLYMADPVDTITRLVDKQVDNQTLPQLILGSEAKFYTEMADASTLDQRIWPRVGALAERLWSNPNTGWKEAKSRMLYHRYRMLDRGIAAETLEPYSCLQQGGCLEDS